MVVSEHEHVKSKLYTCAKRK